jgi:hypothetical protein
MMFRNLLVSAALTLGVVGCGRGAAESDEADDAVATSASTSTESALMSSAAEDSTSMSGSFTNEQIAEAASLKLKSRYKSGCVTATRNLNVVTYVMVDCTGPYGLVKVSGSMVVTYTRQADGSIKADAQGTGLKVNDGTLDLSAVAIYTKNAAGLETAVVESHGTFTGPKGNTGVRVGNYVVTRDQAAQCVTLDGQWSTQWNGGKATSSTEVSGMKKCAASCPAAGGLITHTGVFGKVLTVTLDGSDVAAWSTTGGKSGTIDLECR